ncbi:hypothetical protein NHX12_008772, partial [Muraenolepis orangiensis]
MLSDFLSPFLELDEEFCKNLGGPETADGASASLQRSQRVTGFQRRHSLCPVTLPNSKFNEDGEDQGPEPGPLGLCAEPGRWSCDGRLPRSALGLIPFRVDRSVSMIEGSLAEDRMSAATELCRTYEESGVCKYGSKCQFAHGEDEVRGLHRHPKYKTEPCRTFHTAGFCPYGARCHFIHNADEMEDSSSCPAPPQRPKLRPPLLRHSFSFPRVKRCSYPFSGVLDLAGDDADDDAALRFYALTEAVAKCHAAAASSFSAHGAGRLPPPPRPPGLQRCSSADSL